PNVIGTGSAAAAHDLGPAPDPRLRGIGESPGGHRRIEAPRAALEIGHPGVGIATDGKMCRAGDFVEALARDLHGGAVDEDRVGLERVDGEDGVREELPAPDLARVLADEA